MEEKQLTKNLFTSLIKCDNCGYNYRHISDRKISKYVCQGYARQLPGGCKERHAIEEELLVSVIREYCNINNIDFNKTNSFFNSIIEQITANVNEYTIYYKNGHVSCISPNIIKF